MLKQISGPMFRKMIIAGSGLLEQNKKNVDALNVFPVPDGDTGTNMSMTFKSAANEVNACPNNNLDSLGEALSKGALRGARGNSGVILSQIMKGIASVVMTSQNLSTKQFAKAMTEGAAVAYKAVTKPKEGTILTVIRVMAESAVAAAKKHADFESFFKEVLEKGEEILQKTPEMLPVLKTAGVVDAGGRGLLVVFNGFYKAIIGDEDLNYQVEEKAPVSFEFNNDNFAEVNLKDLADIEFAYCTEFMVINMKNQTTESDIDKLRERLMEIGDCVICIGDLSLVKVHVHTNNPNIVLGYALELGELYNLKIENMLQQNREMKRKREQMQAEKKPFGMVAVAPGKGLADIFKDINIDEVVGGGQTMNPSANDIAMACDRVPSDNVIIFPNNKNIILAAEQAEALTKKTLHVVPTTSVPEGISAALAINPEAELEENLESMKESIKNVKSGSVTYAVRATHIDGFDLKEGDIIGLNEKNILSKGSLVNDTTEDLIEKMMDENVCNITLFYGSDVNEEEAEKFRAKLEEKYPSQDVNMLPGGQPVYYYIISLE